MITSILTGTKKALGIAEEYTAFDEEIISFINGVLATLNQLGIGPEQGFFIEDDGAEWTDFTDGDPRLNAVPTYVYLCVRQLFDPPKTSFHLEAIEKQKTQLEWRLNVVREGDSWTEPLPPSDPDEL